MLQCKSHAYGDWWIQFMCELRFDWSSWQTGKPRTWWWRKPSCTSWSSGPTWINRLERGKWPNCPTWYEQISLLFTWRFYTGPVDVIFAPVRRHLCSFMLWSTTCFSQSLIFFGPSLSVPHWRQLVAGNFFIIFNALNSAHLWVSLLCNFFSKWQSCPVHFLVYKGKANECKCTMAWLACSCHCLQFTATTSISPRRMMIMIMIMTMNSIFCYKLSRKTTIFIT